MGKSADTARTDPHAIDGRAAHIMHWPGGRRYEESRGGSRSILDCAEGAATTAFKGSPGRAASRITCALRDAVFLPINWAIGSTYTCHGRLPLMMIAV